VSLPAEHFLFLVFLVFCRLGIAFSLMPAMGGQRYPVVVRVLFSFGLSLAVAPLIVVHNGMAQSTDADGVHSVINEICIGFAIGLWSFCFLQAVRFAGSFIVNLVGLAGIPGQPIDEQEPSSHLATLLSLGLTAMVFASGLHLQSLEALIASYRLFPLGAAPNPALLTKITMHVLSRTFYLGLQFTSPFIFFSLIWNFSLGLANRMTPQLSVYFAFSGLLSLISIGLIALLAPTLLFIPLSSYADFISRGFQ